MTMDPDDARVVDPAHAAFDGRARGGFYEALAIPTIGVNTKPKRSEAPCPSPVDVARLASRLGRLRPTDPEWLLSVERAVSVESESNQMSRCRAMFIDAREPSHPRIWAEPRPAVEAVEGVRRLIATWPRGSAHGFVRRLLSGAKCFTVSTRLDEDLYRRWASDAKARGAPGDALCIAACVTPGVGVVLWFSLASRAAMPRATCSRWEEVAKALLRAVEARSGGTQEGQVTPPSAGGDSGRLGAGVRERVCEHVSSGSAPVLSAEDAAVFRRELLSGEWRLLDHFDREGRRYFTWTRALERRRTLTKRERDVLERVARGQADRIIAMELRCSPSTVATHRLRAMSKLGLSSRSLFAQILAVVTGDEAPS